MSYVSLSEYYTATERGILLLAFVLGFCFLLATLDVGFTVLKGSERMTPEMLAKRLVSELYTLYGSQMTATNLMFLLHEDEWELIWEESTARRFGRALQIEAEKIGYKALLLKEPRPARGDKNVPLSWKMIGS